MKDMVSKKIMICSMMIMVSIVVILQTDSSNALNESEDYDSYRLSLMPETRYFDQYEQLSAPNNVAVVYPIFTQTAYAWGGIHDFYSGRCETCKTVPIDEFYDPIFSVGAKSFRILEFLGYNIIDDVDIDRDPSILKDFDTIILLHNEYVTQNEFDAITSHSNVIYLYPGVFSSKVIADYSDYSITLQGGPSFPTKDNTSGFDWEFENSNLYKDTLCQSWEFYEIRNGHMLNCTPEYLIQDSDELLNEIKRLSVN